jgi:hypothetical protein
VLLLEHFPASETSVEASVNEGGTTTTSPATWSARGRWPGRCGWRRPGARRVAGGARRRAHPGVLPRLPGKYVTPVQPVRLRPFNFRINLRHSGNTETFLLNWQTHRSVPFHRAQMHRH